MRTSCEALAFVAAAVLLIAGAPGTVQAQQASVRGTVTDAQTGQPISGAQVAVRGSAIGTLTNNNGQYVLTGVPAGRAEIRVEYIGYSPQQQTLTLAEGEAATADFQMGVTAIELEELVATGYAQQTRREVTSAQTSVRNEDLGPRVVASLDAALQGKAAGVQVIQNAGNPGNGITVRVRGSSSISASNQPLYVVDGVPIFREDFGQLGLGGQDLSAITGLNPDEIESINILKDASAAAIYGSRGSNGVIMITTKRGAAGAPRITVQVSGGIQDASQKLDLLNEEEWMEFFNAGAELDGYGAGYFDDWRTGIDTDWQNAVLREDFDAPLSNMQIAINGGTERFKYYLSGTHFDQTGIIIGSGYRRSAGRINLDFSATDRLTLTASLALLQEINDRLESDDSIESAVTNAIANEPFAPIYEEDGSCSGDASYANPVCIGLLNDVEAKTLRSFGNITANYGLLPWLRATGRAGFDVLALREYEYQSSEVPLTYSSGVDGVSQIGNSSGFRTLLEGFLTADRYFDVHEINVTAGASLELNDRELSFVRGEGFTSADLHWPANAARVTDYDGTSWEHNLVSYFARANYTLADRYILNGSLRADGSSRFGENERFGIFPAVSGAWIVSNESFLGDFDLITDLKLRASWGVTGNEAIGDFQFLGLYGTSNYGNVPGTAPSNLPNPDLKWERTTEVNFGVDLSVLNDRLGVVAEIYSKDTDDLLLSRPVTATSGFTSVLDNVGSIENRGWELSLRTVNVRGPALEWTSEFNFTNNENEVTSLPNDEPFTTGFYSANRVEVGQPLGAFYLYRFEGVDPATGDALFTDLDDAGNIVGVTTDPNSADRMIVGSPHPDYFGGFRNTVRWNDFDLGVFLEFSQGADVYNAMRRFADDGGYYYDNKFGDVMDYWRQPGDITDTPRPSYDGSSGARLNSSRFIEDASYVRLQDVTLGYRLPIGLTNLLRMAEGRVYVSGKNIKTWTEYSGYNPDVNSSGSSSSASLGTDFYAYPVARAFTIGFQGTW